MRKQRTTNCISNRHIYDVVSANASTSEVCLSSGFPCQGILELDIGAFAWSSKQVGHEQSVEEVEMEKNI